MTSDSGPLISVCIPAYNRAQFLGPLLDSILSQDFDDYEIVICEDKSPQRSQIAEEAQSYTVRTDKVRYIENLENLGYDANFRELLTQARGRYCFFMGNDDLMADHALARVADVVQSHDDIGLILRAYSWFITDPRRPEQTIRYFGEDRIFPPGADTIATAFRRTGVLSGFVVERAEAMQYATAEFDGFLYYQMYLAASVLSRKRAYYINDVLTWSRSTETPDFGNSSKEKQVFTPGGYTPEARLHMVSGMLTIARAVERKTGLPVYPRIEADIANYVFPYISDQLRLPPARYVQLHRQMSALGLGKYRMFHAHFIAAYLLKEHGYHALSNFVRGQLGRTPQIGQVYGGEQVLKAMRTHS